LRVSRSLCTVGLFCLLLISCADTAGTGPEGYVVRPGDTLYSIAWRNDLDFRDLARWNNIGADFRISVGQVLMLGPGGAPPTERSTPRAAQKPAAAPSPAIPPSTMPPSSATPRVSKPRPLPDLGAAAPNAGAPTAGAPTAGAPNASASNSQGAASPPSMPTGERNVHGWVWPTDRVGAPRVVPGGGILLSGRLGQDVRAASAGRVVYTGSGLRGYGNLVIIKHADSLLSAYAHNRETLVHDGQEVAMGQVIAHMGEGEGAQRSPILYFEIRQNGRPVDPLPFLSKVK
jgi:lipoprotein NlpD